MGIKKQLSEQIKMGKWLGILQLLLNQVAPFFQYFILAFSGIAAWAAISRWIAVKTGLLLPFWLFVLAIFLSLLLAGIIQYKAGWPSYFSVWNWQWWSHNNPMKKRMDEQDKKIAEILEILKKKRK